MLIKIRDLTKDSRAFINTKRVENIDLKVVRPVDSNIKNMIYMNLCKNNLKISNYVLFYPLTNSY